MFFVFPRVTFVFLLCSFSVPFVFLLVFPRVPSVFPLCSLELFLYCVFIIYLFCILFILFLLLYKISKWNKSEINRLTSTCLIPINPIALVNQYILKLMDMYDSNITDLNSQLTRNVVMLKKVRGMAREASFSIPLLYEAPFWFHHEAVM